MSDDGGLTPGAAPRLLAPGQLPPFDMVVCNQLSRYHLAMDALRRVARVRSEVGDLIGRYEQKLAAHRAYIYERGEDMPEVRDWKWT